MFSAVMISPEVLLAQSNEAPARKHGPFSPQGADGLERAAVDHGPPLELAAVERADAGGNELQGLMHRDQRRAASED